MWSSGNGQTAKSKPQPPAQPQAKPVAAGAPSQDIADWQPRLWRELWLAQLTELTEQCMRSPAFLTWLRCSIAFENARSRLFAPQHSPLVSASAPTDHRGENVR